MMSPEGGEGASHAGDRVAGGVVLAMDGGELLPCLNRHNSDKEAGPKLTGSQAKTAYALRLNAESMVKEAGVECCGFLTLTVGDTGADGRFRQVKEAREASRRIGNLNRRVLKDLFEKAILVTERHKNGAIHFHVLGVLRGRPDIRRGFDFEAVKKRRYSSACQELRGLWELLREVLPGYGFGRAELLPVRKTGDAVAAYIAKYIEKNIQARGPQDKCCKLVRYLGWNGQQTKANDFGWAGKRSRQWRARAREMAAVIGCQSPEDCAVALGPRWAFHLTMIGEIVRGQLRDVERPMDLAQWMVAFEGLMKKARHRGWRRPYQEAAHRLAAASGKELELDESFFETWPGLGAGQFSGVGPWGEAGVGG